VGVIGSTLTRHLLVSSGKKRTGDTRMYNDDDDVGSIGADLTTSDISLLDQLANAIAGDDNMDDEYEEIVGELLDDDDDDDDFDDDDEDVEGDEYDEELIGDQEIIGRKRPKRRRSRSRSRKALLRRIMARRAGAVVNKGLSSRRLYPLGFTRTAVAAAASSIVPASPQNLFRPQRLVIPSDIAFSFGLQDIKVGSQSQLVQSVEIPAAMFSEVAVGTQMMFDTAQVGNQVSVDVINNSGASVNFTGALLGTVAK